MGSFLFLIAIVLVIGWISSFCFQRGQYHSNITSSRARSNTSHKA